MTGEGIAGCGIASVAGDGAAIVEWALLLLLLIIVLREATHKCGSGSNWCRAQSTQSQ